MRRINGSVFLSLDGVMQAPGGPTEDPTGGFAFGGWLAPLFDAGVEPALGEVFAAPYDLLLGRRTYDIFAAYWPYVTGDEAGLGEAFTRAGKYVLTRGHTPLPWANSHRLGGIEDLAALKATDGPDLLIQGSSTMYPALLAAGLLDRLTCMIFPVVLGRGKRLFGDATPATALQPVTQSVTAGGVMIATYAPAGQPQTQAITAPSTSELEAERQRRMADGSW